MATRQCSPKVRQQLIDELDSAELTRALNEPLTKEEQEKLKQLERQRISRMTHDPEILERPFNYIAP